MKSIDQIVAEDLYCELTDIGRILGIREKGDGLCRRLKQRAKDIVYALVQAEQRCTSVWAVVHDEPLYVCDLCEILSEVPGDKNQRYIKIPHSAKCPFHILNHQDQDWQRAVRDIRVRIFLGESDEKRKED